MKRPVLLGLVTLLALPSVVQAQKRSAVICGGVHLVRSAPIQEMFTTSYTIRNGNDVEAVTIERLTFRNLYGDVVWESVPGTHPLNTDVGGGLNITTVPPGASYYVSTNHIWGLNDIPIDPANPRLSQGNAISAVIEFSTTGKAKLVTVGWGLRVRQRLLVGPPGGPFTPSQGNELTRQSATCTEVKPSDD